MTGGTDTANGGTDETPTENVDPFKEIANAYTDELRHYADSDEAGSWVAQAILNEYEERGDEE